MCPRPSQWIHGQGGLRRGRLVCHCLLIETNQGLLLVDTGLGTRDIADPHRLGRAFNIVAQPKFDSQETALHQLRALGYAPGDVRHIVATHADLDHIGGIADFPDATVHIYEDEYRAILERSTFLERHRYRRCQWNTHTKWEAHPLAGERFEGFDAVRPIANLSEVLLVPLPGHSRGHAGVAVHTQDGWLLHAGDAYFHRAQLDPERPYTPVGLAAHQRVMDFDTRLRHENQERLRVLRAERGTQIQIFCSHDPMEFDICCRTEQAIEQSRIHVEDEGRGHYT